MTLLAPGRLVLLVPVLAAVLAYVWLQRRRRHHAVRFTNLELLESVAPDRPGWRRHVTAGIAVTAMVVLVVAMAQPVVQRSVARERAVVVIALDVSLSMDATDVTPTRLTAAKQAASGFVLGLPDQVRVGVVAYGGTVQVVVPPTTDHEAAATAVARLTTIEGTATGEAVQTSLDAIEVALADVGLADPQASTTLPTDTAPATIADRAPATIVLLSDGASADGRPVIAAAERAAALGVPVTTITYGTAGGTIEIDGEVVPVPPEPRTMQQVATITGGSSFEAASAAELASVYDDLETQIGAVTEEQEVTIAAVALGLLLLIAAFVAGLLWSGRVF